jgi:hypothetical protein
MTRPYKDIVGAGLTFLVVLTFFAAYGGWNVPLVGDSYRWAATVVAVLGIATCALGSASRETARSVLAGLGTGALFLSVIAIASGSPAVLALLVLDIVLLWGLATLGHAQHHPPRHVAT